MVEINGEINVLAASKAVTRKIPYKITYKRGHQRELVVKFDGLQVKGYEKAMMTLKVDSNGLKLDFGNEAGQKGPKYQINVSGQVENQGKCLRAQAHWNMVKSPNIFKVEETNSLFFEYYCLSYNSVLFCCLKYFGLFCSRRWQNYLFRSANVVSFYVY